MSTQPFIAFIDLINFDQNSKKLHHERELLEEEIGEFEKKIDQQKNALDDTVKTLAALKKEVDSYELRIKEIEGTETQKKRQLDKVSNQREYKSIQGELAAIHKSQNDTEERLVELWNRYEGLKNQYKEQKIGFATFIDEISQEIKEKTSELSSFEKQIIERKQQRESKLLAVPDEWLEKYSDMSAHVSDPVVPVVNESCSACFYLIPRQNLVLLERGQLIQCGSCYRLLYLKHEGASEEDKELSGS